MCQTAFTVMPSPHVLRRNDEGYVFVEASATRHPRHVPAGARRRLMSRTPTAVKLRLGLVAASTPVGLNWGLSGVNFG
jgi:hypothetical protein